MHMYIYIYNIYLYIYIKNHGELLFFSFYKRYYHLIEICTQILILLSLSLSLSFSSNYTLVSLIIHPRRFGFASTNARIYVILSYLFEHEVFTLPIDDCNNRLLLANEKKKRKKENKKKKIRNVR